MLFGLGFLSSLGILHSLCTLTSIFYLNRFFKLRGLIITVEFYIFHGGSREYKMLKVGID